MPVKIDRKKLAVTSARLGLLTMAAISVSFFICFAARSFIFGQTMKLQRETADVIAGRQPGIFHAQSRNESDLKMSFAPFGVPDSNPASQPAAIAPSSSANIKDFKLIGTLPPVGAWIEFNNEVSLMLKGHERNGYILDEIEPEYAVFTQGTGKFTLYLTYWSPGSRRANAPPSRGSRAPQTPPSPPPPPDLPATAAEDSGVIAAEPNGEDGAISRELLNELLVNPLAEVGKNRLVPTEDGMMIMGMRSDSLFLKLGLKPNDVITNVNGIGINDVGNVSNAISSMLSGTRLDFQIEREGESVKLGYAVR
jgi:hypothetical protein